MSGPVSGSFESDVIRWERVGDVLVVTIDRPDSELNAVNGELHADLARCMAALREERDARAVLLTGAGRAFCAGGDFGWFPTLRSAEALAELAIDARSMIVDLLHVEAPVVCALNGHAMGLGASIALLCDLIVMADHATIGDPHTKVGLVAGDGGAVIWPLVLGPARAKEALLLGGAVSADDALRLGLVNRVVPADQVRSTALDLARRLAAMAPLAVRSTKVAVNHGVLARMAEVFDLGVELELETFLSRDHAEAISAIVERRDPHYEGR